MKDLRRSRAMCEWDEFAEAAPRLRAIMLEKAVGLLPPFMFLTVPGISAKEHRTCSELWMQERHTASLIERDKLAFGFDLARRDKIRVAYLSNDLQNHATSHLLIEMFEAHDPARFETHAFSFGGIDESVMRHRLKNAFHGFHDISALTDIEAAQAIHAAGIDLLVDLKGYTAGARPSIMMLHPAPVQVNYLGYPGTLGADICDYIITDPFVTPLSTAADYSESFAYMRHSYQPHGRTGEIGIKPARSEVGLPETGFVFCCFNQAYKITPSVFDLWCRLLEDTPGSVLWLLHAREAEGNLRREAFARGIGADRLIFAPDMGQSRHLGRLQLADLVLDTAPYGAHTTASDALWAGVPIVTCAGDTFASRVAGSLLHAVGMAELIAANEDDYIAIASVLANEPERLAKLKAKLGREHLTAPLFDVAAYTRSLEDLYETMWHRRRLGASHGHRTIWASET